MSACSVLTAAVLEVGWAQWVWGLRFQMGQIANSQIIDTVSVNFKTLTNGDVNGALETFSA